MFLIEFVAEVQTVTGAYQVGFQDKLDDNFTAKRYLFIEIESTLSP